MKNQIVKNAAMLSSIAYKSELEIRTHLSNKFKSFVFFNDLTTDTQAFVCQDDENIYISCRGTEMSSLKDVKTDIRFFKTSGIHSGFYSAAKIILDLVLMIKSKFDSENKPIIFTGHSLGAGIASVMIEKSGEHLPGKKTLITFGSPRVFSKDFKFQTQFETMRFVNNNDTITRMPPRIFGYKHIGDLYYFKENGSLSKNPLYWEVFLASINGRIKDIGEWGTDGLKDHPINEYVKLVNGNF